MVFPFGRASFIFIGAQPPIPTLVTLMIKIRIYTWINIGNTEVFRAQVVYSDTLSESILLWIQNTDTLMNSSKCIFQCLIFKRSYIFILSKLD